MNDLMRKKRDWLCCYIDADYTSINYVEYMEHAAVEFSSDTDNHTKYAMIL